MAYQRILRLFTVALLQIAASACTRDKQESAPGAVNGPEYHLSADYPTEFRAGETVLSEKLIARGDSLYHGVIGQANCVLCHGPFLKGGSHGTDLRDQEWHHGDGSYPLILATITQGVPESVHSPIPRMPPMGGVPLSVEELQALAAYVYWFSNTRASSDGGSG